MPADSPYETIDDFVAAWKADPRSIAVGGGSSPGGPDHLFPMQLAETVGIDPKDVLYVPYDGGGPLTSALLGEKIKVGFSGPRRVRGPDRVRRAAGPGRLGRGAARRATRSRTSRP